MGGKAARSLIDHREQIGLITEDVMEIEVGYLFSFSLHYAYALQLEREREIEIFTTTCNLRVP